MATSVSILIIGIVSSYGSSSLMTLFNRVLQPESKTVEWKTLNQSKTNTKDSMIVIPKKFILSPSMSDINSSKSTYLKPQAMDRFTLDSKNDMLTPISQSITAYGIQGEFTSIHANPSQTGNVAGYYVLFTPPEGITQN